MCLCGMCLCGSTTFCRIRMSHTCRMPCYDASGCAHRFGGVFVCTERLDSNESQFEPSSGVCNGIPLHAPLLGRKASGIRSSECDKRFASPSTKVAQRAPFCFSNTKSLRCPADHRPTPVQVNYRKLVFDIQTPSHQPYGLQGIFYRPP